MKKILCLSLVCMLAFCGCAGSEPETTQSTATEAFTYAPITVTTEATKPTEHEQDISDLIPDPPYSFDVDSMVPSDFGDFFKNSYDVKVSTYTINSGDEFDNTVTLIDSGKPGKTVYVIAGIHGDEEAAWQTGKLLKKIGIKAGKLYIVAPANRWGAASTPKSRYIDGKDPNRVWPGTSDGNGASRYANALFNDVWDKEPDFVFDLHEAKIIESGRDYLGSSLIYSNMDLFGDLIIDMVLATQEGSLCNRPFTYYAPGPEGSINRTITEKLEIPVLTVETFRGYQMEDRISDQLAVVQYVLQEYGLVD